MLSMYNNTSDPELGWFVSRLFPLLRQNDARNKISEILRPFFNANFRDYFRPGTDTQLTAYLGGDDQLRMLIIDGVETSRQTAGLIAGYDNTHGLFDLQGYNPWLDTAANNLMTLDDLGAIIPPFQRLRIYGYSAGGAVGQWVMKKWNAAGHGFNAAMTTYGAPRAMSEPDARSLFNSSVTRWMVDADPIPLVPPRFEDAPLLHLVLPVSATLRYGTYIHLQGGWSLDPAGVATPAFVPPIAALNVTGALYSWYFGVANDPGNPHWIGNYEDRLFLLKERAPDTQAGIGGGGDDETPENAPRRHIDRQANAVAAQVAHRADIQNANAVAIDSVVLFKAVRFRRTWCVALGNQLFAFAGNKKRARHLARAGNDFLRSMPKQAVVDPDSLLTQLTSFFNAAVVPGGPVRPPINVGL